MKTVSRRTVVGYLTAVFVVGIAVGGVGGYTSARKTPTTLPAAQKFEDGWLEKYRSQLALTDEQVQAVRPLLPEAVQDLRGIWYRAIMTMGAVQESVDRKVEPLLNDAQRGKLQAMIRQGRERRVRVAHERFDSDFERQDHIWYAAAASDLEAIRRHLQGGVEVNGRNLAFGMTPLAVAAVHGRRGSCEVLLEEGADVNARNSDGNTVLHGAAFFGRLEVVRLLLENGADSNLRNHDGKTPLEAMDADWETIQFIAAILEVEIRANEVKSGRQAVAELLAASRVPEGEQGNDM